MDLTQLTNLGEFIGGVAVLVTLVYLALQVRQGTRAVETTNHHALLEFVTNADTLIARDGDLSELEMRAAETPDELTDLEWRRFRSLALARFGGWEAAYLNRERGLMDPESWAAFDGGFRVLLVGPGYARFWAEAAGAHAPAFRRYFEAEVLAR